MRPCVAILPTEPGIGTIIGRGTNANPLKNRNAQITSPNRRRPGSIFAGWPGHRRRRPEVMKIRRSSGVPVRRRDPLGAEPWSGTMPSVASKASEPTSTTEPRSSDALRIIVAFLATSSSVVRPAVTIATAFQPHSRRCSAPPAGSRTAITRTMSAPSSPIASGLLSGSGAPVSLTSETVRPRSRSRSASASVASLATSRLSIDTTTSARVPVSVSVRSR